MFEEPSDLVIENLSKSFDGRSVLKGVNLKLNAGESVVVIGGSGSGKSVLLKTISGLMLPDAGSVVRVGENDISRIHISKRSEFLKNFGMLFQGSALFDSLNVWQNITFGLQQENNLAPEDAKQIALDKMKLVGLKEHVAELYPSEISGGMQKRVSLARTIVNDPKLIFFDEPTTGLDPIMSSVISELIVQLLDELKASAITITHDMSCMNRVADKVAMLYEGHIIWQGAPDSIESCDNAHIKQFVSGSVEGPIKAQ